MDTQQTQTEDAQEIQRIPVPEEYIRDLYYHIDCLENAEGSRMSEKFEVLNVIRNILQTMNIPTDNLKNEDWVVGGDTLNPCLVRRK